MAQNPETASSSLIELQRVIGEHLNAVLAQSDTSTRYVEATREKSTKLDELVRGSGSVGEIRGLVSGWMDDVQPVAEAVFGVSLEGQQIGRFGDERGTYYPTVFEDISGRVRIISTDEIWGPTLSVDVVRQRG